MSSIQDLVAQARKGHKYSLAKLVAGFEDRRASSSKFRIEALAAVGTGTNARVVGITGTPGAGKSTLVGEIANRLSDLGHSIAVVAVDPSSPVSGGSLLGDRTRVRIVNHPERVFFRSQSSDGMLGGLGPQTHNAVRLLSRLFDFVFIETVGIGQNETHVSMVADFTYLVLQPLGGDQVQFIKAGIMEVPNVFVLNKCDEEQSARKSYYALRNSLKLAHGIEQHSAVPPIIRCSAHTGLGIGELIESILAIPQPTDEQSRNREANMFQGWARSELGHHATGHLSRTNGARAWIDQFGFDHAQLEFSRSFAQDLLSNSTTATMAAS